MTTGVELEQSDVYCPPLKIYTRPAYQWALERGGTYKLTG